MKDGMTPYRTEIDQEPSLIANSISTEWKKIHSHFSNISREVILWSERDLVARSFERIVCYGSFSTGHPGHPWRGKGSNPGQRRLSIFISAALQHYISCICVCECVQCKERVRLEVPGRLRLSERKPICGGSVPVRVSAGPRNRAPKREA